MEAPAQFVSTLEREFQGRLRIRWSPLREEWHIEEKRGRGIFEVPLLAHDDRFVRVRDGYSHVMAIKPRDYMHCPLCNDKLPVPLFHTAEAKCGRCARQGKDARFRAAFYPLNHHLILYLKQIDPLRTVDLDGHSSLDDLVAGVDADNARLASGQTRATHNRIEDATLDQWKDLADIGRSTKPR